MSFCVGTVSWYRVTGPCQRHTWMANLCLEDILNRCDQQAQGCCLYTLLLHVIQPCACAALTCVCLQRCSTECVLAGILWMSAEAGQACCSTTAATGTPACTPPPTAILPSHHVTTGKACCAVSASFDLFLLIAACVPPWSICLQVLCRFC